MNQKASMTGIHSTIAAVALFVCAGMVSAVTLPTYYPATFRVVGTIDRLDVENGEIVISDRLFQVTGDTSVHLLTRQSSALAALSVGMTVGGDDMIDDSGRRTLIVIYELPSDFPVRGR